MKKLIAVLVLFGSIHTIQAQRQELTIGVNRNHFYDFHKTARNFESKDHNGLSLAWSIDNMDTHKFPLRATIKMERYSGAVNIFNGGLGGGLTLDADVKKDMIALGLYPLNFSIKHLLEFNVGVEFSALIQENAKGGYYYYQGGSPPISTSKPLDDGAYRASNSFGVGLNARVAYNIPIQKGWSLVPQYQLVLGVSKEFRDIQSDTRSIRHYLAIGFAKNLHVKQEASEK